VIFPKGRFEIFSQIERWKGREEARIYFTPKIEAMPDPAQTSCRRESFKRKLEIDEPTPAMQRNRNRLRALKCSAQFFVPGCALTF